MQHASIQPCRLRICNNLFQDRMDITWAQPPPPPDPTHKHQLSATCGLHLPSHQCHMDGSKTKTYRQDLVLPGAGVSNQIHRFKIPQTATHGCSALLCSALLSFQPSTDITSAARGSYRPLDRMNISHADWNPELGMHSPVMVALARPSMNDLEILDLKVSCLASGSRASC